MIEPLKGKQTLKAAELQDGDIICFQRTSDKKAENGRISDKASQEAYVIFPSMVTTTCKQPFIERRLTFVQKQMVGPRRGCS